jgi:phosphatidylserine/phosphatidylglycerophosphate/cardiolipin synthase-like enzyme
MVNAKGGLQIRYMERTGSMLKPWPRVALWLLITVVMCGSPTRLTALEQSQPVPSWQVYFSPEGGCTQAIVNAIGAARKQILVQAYEMTSAPIKSALTAARRRGVQVSAIFDPEALRAENSMVGALNAGGVAAFVDSAHRPGLAHNKVMVIDQQVVITGSFNFTKAAETRNAENLLIIHDPALAAQYARNFAAHLAHSSPLGATDTPAPKPTYHRHHYYRHRRHHYYGYW